MKKLKLKKNNFPGKLIVFEGTDGAGKTTLINKAVETLMDVYGSNSIIQVKQPTDLSRKTKLFQKMMYSQTHDDIDYRAVQLLTMSDRIQQGYEVIEPALKSGKIVICDRYLYTSYINMLGRNYINEKWFVNVSQHIVEPNLTILAYVDPSTAIKRIKERPNEKDRYFDEELLHKVSSLFKEYGKRNKFAIIDTSDDCEIAFEELNKVLNEIGLI